jgi:putative ABC transport system substrate-binding protein
MRYAVPELVTGVTIFGPAAVTKRLQLLHNLVPQAAVIAFLMNPNNPNSTVETKTAQTAADALGGQIVVFSATGESELDAAFASMVGQRIGALLGASDGFLFSRRELVVSLAARYRIPAIYYLPEFVRAGGLMSYGNSLTDPYRTQQRIELSMITSAVSEPLQGIRLRRPGTS